MGLKILAKMLLFRENSNSWKFWISVSISLKISYYSYSPTSLLHLACDRDPTMFLFLFLFFLFLFLMDFIRDFTHAQVFCKTIIFLKEYKTLLDKINFQALLSLFFHLKENYHPTRITV